jgi:hypothetical protein
MAIFIEYPWLAAVIGVALVAAGLRRHRRAALAAGLTWVLYSVYEMGMKQRWLCTGECNIRVDLLLIYPMLVVLTLVAVVNLLRTARESR